MRKIISSVTQKPYRSTSLNYELGKLSAEQSQIAAHLTHKFTIAFSQNPQLELKEIIASMSSESSEIANLNTLLNTNCSLAELRHNLAFKALLLTIRSWQKTNWHVHFSDHIDGQYVLSQIRPGIVYPFDFRRSILHIKDDWIRNENDFTEAFLYVITQIHEDGITEANIRFNPYKSFLAEDHLTRLQRMGPFLDRLSKAVKAECEKLSCQSNRPLSIGFIASLDRRKYSRNGPEVLFDIIKQVSSLHKLQKAPLLKGIDVCGAELMSWETNETTVTESGNTLFQVMNEATAAGLHLVSHLGDLKHMNKRLIPRYLDNPNDVVGLLLHNLYRYIVHVPEMSGIGHGTILSDLPFLSEENKTFRDEILSYIRAHRQSLVIERCYYDDAETLEDIRTKSPIYFWKQQNIPFVFGNDGVIHTSGHYEPGKASNYEAVSFSQWILLAMLAAPRNEGWTINYVKSKAE